MYDSLASHPQCHTDTVTTSNAFPSPPAKTSSPPTVTLPSLSPRALPTSAYVPSPGVCRSRYPPKPRALSSHSRSPSPDAARGARARRQLCRCHGPSGRLVPARPPGAQPGLLPATPTPPGEQLHPPLHRDPPDGRR